MSNDNLNPRQEKVPPVTEDQNLNWSEDYSVI